MQSMTIADSTGQTSRDFTVRSRITCSVFIAFVHPFPSVTVTMITFTEQPDRTRASICAAVLDEAKAWRSLTCLLCVLWTWREVGHVPKHHLAARDGEDSWLEWIAPTSVPNGECWQNALRIVQLQLHCRDESSPAI